MKHQTENVRLVVPFGLGVDLLRAAPDTGLDTPGERGSRHGAAV